MFSVVSHILWTVFYHFLIIKVQHYFGTGFRLGFSAAIWRHGFYCLPYQWKFWRTRVQNRRFKPILKRGKGFYIHVYTISEIFVHDHALSGLLPIFLRNRSFIKCHISVLPGNILCFSMLQTNMKFYFCKLNIYPTLSLTRIDSHDLINLKVTPYQIKQITWDSTLLSSGNFHYSLVLDRGSLGPSTVTLIALLYVATWGGLVDTIIVSVKLFPGKKDE